MVKPTHQTAQRQALTPRAAIGIVYFCFGVAVGLWGGSVAEVARLSSISPEVVGSAFFGYSIAGIAGMTVVARVGRSVSLKVRLVVVLILAAACLALLFQVRSAIEMIAGVFAFSFLASCVDLVMNSEGLAVEMDRGAPVMASFHGLASLGIALGAISGSYLSVKLGLAVTAGVGVLVYGVAVASALLGTPDRGATQPAGSGSSWFRPNRPLIAISLIVGTSIAGELAATMFSAQTLTAQAPRLAAYAGFGATAFALCQAAVRMAGDRLRLLFGDERLIRLSLATALAGFVLLALSENFWLSAAGFAVVGVGTALIVPCGFVMAARRSMLPAAAVISMLSLISGAIRIPAPLIYGSVAQQIGFSPAFSIYALLAVAALALAMAGMGATRTRRPA